MAFKCSYSCLRTGQFLLAFHHFLGHTISVLHVSMPSLVLTVQRMHPVSKRGFSDAEKGDGMAVCFLIFGISLPSASWCCNEISCRVPTGLLIHPQPLKIAVSVHCCFPRKSVTMQSVMHFLSNLVICIFSLGKGKFALKSVMKCAQMKNGP